MKLLLGKTEYNLHKVRRFPALRSDTSCVEFHTRINENMVVFN